MVTTKDKAGQTVYITSTPDCEYNKDGYYCEAYSDRNCDHKIDDFCIHPDDIPGYKNMPWQEQEKAIEKYMAHYYDDKVLDINYNFDHTAQEEEPEQVKINIVCDRLFAPDFLRELANAIENDTVAETYETAKGCAEITEN